MMSAANPYEQWPVSDEVKDKIRAAGLPSDVERVALLEAYHRERILTSSDRDRKAAYVRAYEDLDELSAERGQDVHGADRVFMALFHRWRGQGRVVELGCGTGMMAALLATRCRSYVGIDASAHALALAAKRAPSAVFSRQVAPDIVIPSADLIYSNDFFEHLHQDDLAQVLQACRAALQPRGTLALISSNRAFGPFDVSRRYLSVGDAPGGLHLTELTYGEWKVQLRAAGFMGSISTPSLPLRALSAPVVGRGLNRVAWRGTRVKEYLERRRLPPRTASHSGVAAIVLAAQPA